MTRNFPTPIRSVKIKNRPDCAGAAGVISINLLLQPEKQIPRGRRDGDAVGAVGGSDGITARRPACRRGDVRVLLQGVSVGGGIRPENFHAVRPIGNNQQFRHAGHLHHVDERPITAGDGITTAGQRPARIRLADGAAHGISPAGAGAAAAGNLIPVNRVAFALGLMRESASPVR